MVSKTGVLLGCIVMQVVIGLGRGDIAKDREKCANQLVGLATCLPYVSGEAKAPPSDCCTGFKQVLKNSKECICLLVKDRNDPSLGLKINATLALSLPAKCNSPVNESITDCPTLLHLPPNSPDAKIFQDFAKGASTSNTTTTTPTPTPTSGSSSTTSSAASDQKSDGGEMMMMKNKKNIWFEAQMVVGVLIALAHLH